MSEPSSSNLINQPHCQARSKRTLSPCRQPRMRGKAVCRFHGGKSTGPKTREGKERIRQANLRHGRYSKNAAILRLEIKKQREANRRLSLLTIATANEAEKLACLEPYIAAFHRVENKIEMDFLAFLIFGGLRELLKGNKPLKNALREFYSLLEINDGTDFVDALLVQMDEKVSNRLGLSRRAYASLTPAERSRKFFGSLTDQFIEILAAMAE
jgi:hypothetical protein